MNDKEYNKWLSMSDFALAQSLGVFLKYHRLQQNKTQELLAKEANISRSTLSLLEKGETVTIATLFSVLRVLNLLYVMETFKVDDQISPIKLAELEQKKKKRASKTITKPVIKTTW